MSKTKILMVQIIGCIALGMILGVAFRQCDGGKTHPVPIKEYSGHWVEDIKQVGDWWSSRYLQRVVIGK